MISLPLSIDGVDGIKSESLWLVKKNSTGVRIIFLVIIDRLGNLGQCGGALGDRGVLALDNSLNFNKNKI